MGSETCLKNSDEWCSLTFRAQKSCLRLNLRVLRASWRKPGAFFGFAHSPREVWVFFGFVHSPTQTPNEKIMTVLVSICLIYGSPWTYFIFSCAFCLTAPKFLSSILDISFPHIYWPMPGMPFCSWLSRAWVIACHPAKTRRIRHIAAGFSSIYGQMRLPGS